MVQTATRSSNVATLRSTPVSRFAEIVTNAVLFGVQRYEPEYDIFSDGAVINATDNGGVAKRLDLARGVSARITTELVAQHLAIDAHMLEHATMTLSLLVQRAVENISRYVLTVDLDDEPRDATLVGTRSGTLIKVDDLEEDLDHLFNSLSKTNLVESTLSELIEVHDALIKDELPAA